MPNRTEETLYASIEHALKRSGGLEVRERLTVRVGLRTRTPDHVAWRWDSTELRLFAVEAKVGSRPADGALALAQATEYQVGIPYVFAAAEGSVKELGYLRRVLDHLGVGYIRAKRDTRSAGDIESDPAEVRSSRTSFIARTLHGYVSCTSGVPRSSLAQNSIAGMTSGPTSGS